MKSILPLLCTLLIMNSSFGQETPLPYYEIPDAPKSYSAESVTARMIDGLGFRYFWATDGLRELDLEFRPSEGARNTRETIDHIYGLTSFFLSSLTGSSSELVDVRELSFDEVRSRTLNNIKQASDLLKSGTKLEGSTIKTGNGSEFPFWNNINGPISDAIWHVGQVITFRRSSGNPYNSKASVFTGKVRK